MPLIQRKQAPPTPDTADRRTRAWIIGVRLRPWPPSVVESLPSALSGPAISSSVRPPRAFVLFLALARCLGYRRA